MAFLIIFALILLSLPNYKADEVEEYLLSVVVVLQRIGRANLDDINELERIELLWQEHCRIFNIFLAVAVAAEVCKQTILMNIPSCLFT